MELTEQNYYENHSYMSASLFKDFLKCPACAMAKLNGEWKPEKSKALILGSYVDESLTGTPESQREFLQKHEKDIFKKGGGKYADFEKADEAVRIVKGQPLMMKYLDGEHQKVMTGEIAGVPFKGKFDSYKEGEFIADLKYVVSLRSPNLFENVVSYWGYDIQGAIYRELVRQQTGKTLPFYLVMVTKESPAHFTVCEISNENLDRALEVVKQNVGTFWQMRNGEIPAERCEEYDCDYCTSTEVLTEVIDSELLGMSRKMRGDLI
jgi:hypothetical protein